MSDNMHIRYCEWRWNLLRLTSFAYSTSQLIIPMQWESVSERRLSECWKRVSSNRWAKTFLHSFTCKTENYLKDVPSVSNTHRYDVVRAIHATAIYSNLLLWSFISFIWLPHLRYIARWIMIISFWQKTTIESILKKSVTETHGVRVAHSLRMKSRGAEQFERKVKKGQCYKQQCVRLSDGFKRQLLIKNALHQFCVANNELKAKPN